MTTRVLSSGPGRLPLSNYCYSNSSSRLSSSILPTFSVQRVKRCLFPADGEEQQTTGNNSDSERPSSLQLAQMELQRQLEADCRRWNFDFVREVPLALDGSTLEWTPTCAQTTSDGTDESGLNTKNQPQHLRQSHITDFLQPRKRSCSSALNGLNKRQRRT